MTAPVTIVSCLYGLGYDKFIEPWATSIQELNTQPESIIVASDHLIFGGPSIIDGVQIRVDDCSWSHPQAYYLQHAITAADSEWVWILDIDDTALPDALDGISSVQGDVWQMGYERSDGETYIPPQLTAHEYLELKGANPFTGTSAIWRDAFLDCGGFPDVAFQDYGLWRRLAWIDARFESSGRAHFRYNLHEEARTRLELVPEHRDYNMAEMLESEHVVRH